MKAERLRVDYLESPLGLGNPAPRFYWNCEGGVAQTAYQIVCRRNDENVWDSGKVASASMTHIPYAGVPLKSRDVVDWTVTLWDENGVKGEPCDDRFELGLLEPADWTAQWIAGDYRPNPKRRYPVDCFKREFDAEGVVKARLYASARGVYDATLNGHRVEDFILAPGTTDYRKRIQYQTYDVTRLLRAHNALELRIGDGWYRGSVAAYGVTNAFGTQTSLIAQLELTFADGRTETIATDESWSWSNDGPIRFADLKDGEVYNAAMSPSYRGQAKVVTAPKGAILTASDNVPVTEHERLTPVLLSGNVLDFGQNIAGYLAFTVRGRRGQRLRIVCGEMLDESGNVTLKNVQETKPVGGWTHQKLIKKLMTGKTPGASSVPTPLQEILFTCSGKEDHYKTSFAVFGFRYAQVIGDIALDPADFTAIAVYSDLEQTGDFSCSNKQVNRLLENTRWSMKGNFLDVPTDCPTRERLGWTGDAQLFFDTGACLMNTAPFFRKWIRDMADAQYPNGLLPAVVPLTGVEMMYKATGSSVGWADAAYLVPYRFAKRYNDMSILREAWPMIRRYTDYLLKKREKDGHYEKGVHLGEWLEPEEFRDKVYGAKAKHPEECTAYLYLAMNTIAKIADALGETAYAGTLRAAADAAKRVYPSFAEHDTDRQAKLVRPLALGLCDGEERNAAQKRLAQAVERYNYRVGTGFLSTPFLLPMLAEAGEIDAAYRMLENTEKPGWLYEVAQGATTVWETWEGYTGDPGSGSLNHYSPGAVCGWLFDTVAGIRVRGENHFEIMPMPGGTLKYAQAACQSLYGKVVSRWERTADGIRYTITVPSNCTATIRLPDGSEQQIKAGVYSYVR